MSAASAKTQEPSMEEILASIRRIIAEDQDAPKDAEPERIDGSDSQDGGFEDVLELPHPVAVAAPQPEPAPEPEPDTRPDLEIAVPEILFSDDAGPEPVAAPLPRPEPARPLEAVMRAS
ncbi:MAG: hypothetical protein JWQ36_3203, partial [Enterovirga sp.]|nr:hypothetical protein [Enterovirga sp.]